MTPPAVVDTVVLRYFLFVDKGALLLDLLGRPIYVPRVVYDPDEDPGVPDAAMSEMTRSIMVQGRWAADSSRTGAERQIASRNVSQLSGLAQMVQSGDLVIVDLTPDEQTTFAGFVDPEPQKAQGRVLPLGRGEAACVTLALTREWVFASDDSDGIATLKAINPKHPHERIRRLLVRAANTGMCSEDEANEIHREMMRLGFWDKTPPFKSS